MYSVGIFMTGQGASHAERGVPIADRSPFAIDANLGWCLPCTKDARPAGRAVPASPISTAMRAVHVQTPCAGTVLGTYAVHAS